VRTLETMIPIYHDIVGRGMVMELAFAPDRDGLLEASHAAVYRQLGDWVRQCYGAPLASVLGVVGSTFSLELRAGQTFDRVQLQEDIALGQRVRKYTLERRDAGGPWLPLVSGRAIGRKRIHLLPKAVDVAEAGMRVRLRVEGAIARPALKLFAVFAPCPDGSTPAEIHA